MVDQREQSEQERMRCAVFQCLNCSNGLVVGTQYPFGMIVPRTLELWCGQCHAISIIYQTSFWGKEVKKAA